MTKKAPEGYGYPRLDWLRGLAERVKPLSNLNDFFVSWEDDTNKEAGTFIQAEDRSVKKDKSYGDRHIRVARFVRNGYVEAIRASIQNTAGLVEDLIQLYQEYDRLLQAYKALELLVRRAIRAEGLEEPEFRPIELMMKGDDERLGSKTL
jgi:hypothetical protein